MNEKNKAHQHKDHRDYIITAIAVGSVFILIGVVFVINANLPEHIVTFFNNLKTVKFPPNSATSTFFLPAPINPAAHGIFYSALAQFAWGISILQIIIVALRLIWKSPTGRIAETIGNLVFWLGAGVLVSSVLAVGTIDSWFQFWGAFIIVTGISLIARAMVHFVRR